MEASISAFCRSLSAFCHHVESASDSLSDSIQRRPIPLDSAASAFLQCLDRRVSAASADLDLLESMALGTVSFEELLGHCNEVYKINLKYISDLEDRFASFGYVPEVEDDEGGDEDSGVLSKYMSPDNGVGTSHFACRKRLNDDFLFEDSVSLRNLGFSDACLATLASEGDERDATLKKFSELDMSDDEGQPHEKITFSQLTKDVLNTQDGSATNSVIKVSKDDYDNLPSYMKTLASWEELQDAVVKLNSYFCKDRSEGSDKLNQDDTEKIGLGRKGRSYLLVLLRMNQLTMENIDGSIFYHTCVN
ncbi:uncharacterized protein LOC109712554 isoform X2 [Ananas comosus]|uniref:Uncharacterized protein LOC109712554 isoform X2 n=1 Tax=Ananas comosus TaxID=4615 RepID=A0A6P5F6D9_ANACO|nr:uncharacterized protein LOC109712554 isoform X2 [Ananas comosus]